MASSLGSLVVSLGLDAAQFVDGLTKSQYQARQFVRGVTDTTKRAAGVLAAFGVAAGVAMEGLGQAAGHIAVYKDLADQIGDTAEAVAGLQLAADLSGKSIETVASASVKLTSALSKSGDEGKGVGAALAAINIPLAEFKQLDPVAQLELVAQKFAEFEDGAGKTAVAVALFGRAGAELIPFLNDLAETGGRNVRLTQEQIDAADAFAKQYDRLKSEARQFLQVLVAEVIPAAGSFVTELGKIAKEAAGAGGAISSITGDGTIRRWAETAAVWVARVAESFLFLGKAAGVGIGAVNAALADVKLGGAVAKNMFGGFLFESNRKELAQALADRNKTVEAFNGQLNDLITYDGAKLSRTLEESFGNQRMGAMVGLNSKILGGGPKRPKLNFELPGGGGAGGGKDKAAEEAARYLESLQKQLEATKDLSVEEQLLTDIRMGRLGKVSEGQQAELQAVARQIDQARAAKALFEEEARAKQAAFELSQRRGEAAIQEADALVLSNQQLRDEIAAIGLNAEERAKLEQQILSTAIARKEEALVMAQNAGATDAEITALRRQIELLKERRDLLGKKGAAEGVAEAAKEADEFAKSLGMTFSSAFEDAIVSGNSLRDVLKGLEQDILRIITRKLVTEPLANALGNMLSGSKGSGGGGFLGAIFGSLFGGGKAAGGPVRAGRFYEVNERRNELLSVGGRDFLMAGAAGRVRPNPAFAQDAQPMTVHMTVVAQDVESFRRSEAQVTTRLGMALNRGRRFG